MKPVNLQELQICDAPFAQQKMGFVERVKASLAVINRTVRPRHGTDRLPARLRRDAGLDELELERTRMAKSPLIR
ncbi:hypothetical protein OEW28_13690 [Defluviimonas sp. WL0002]|uniref:Uncharacterized protein n=1 Tax=Albidovulum marisflavi TaxID=2984159 RepID=A0ABT2ZF01_9RHOB|nr:hypothetical protein [Defluviimonas sp. WL0002]MCV2869682.1 hypothetical protein [Defluviimonas sp. WL0002]